MSSPEDEQKIPSSSEIPQTQDWGTPWRQKGLSPLLILRGRNWNWNRNFAVGMRGKVAGEAIWEFSKVFPHLPWLGYV